MMEFASGDILHEDAEALVNRVNCERAAVCGDEVDDR